MAKWGELLETWQLRHDKVLEILQQGSVVELAPHFTMAEVAVESKESL